ncbi:MAG: glycosyltransferase family 39 protein [Caldilineales bacterium]|nr:glycosyltransferase family 39 protein [Caldilineales bacterium]MCW5858772.1 glycosyltransferase family 39 protein [Caldilineales bacterium]
MSERLATCWRGQPGRWLALAAIVAYLIFSWPRLIYPYDLDFIEDGMLMQAWRMAHSLSTYLPANAIFVPHAYPPLYPWLGSWLLRLAGAAFWPLRALSVLATIATALILFGVARRESRSNLLAAAVMVLFFLGNRVVGGWYELARVDALFLMLVVAGFSLAVYRTDSMAGLIAAALALMAAFFSKQQGVLFFIAASCYLLWARRGRSWPFFAAGIGVGSLVFFWLQRTTSGGFGYYVFAIQGGSSDLQLIRLLRSLVWDFAGSMAALVALLSLAVFLAWRRRGWRFFLLQPWFFFTAVAVGVALLGRTSVGGNLNHLMPAYALLCLAPALLWAELAQRPASHRRRSRWILGAALAMQLGLCFFNPARYLTSAVLPLQLTPTAAMRAAGDRLIARIAAADGPVLVLQHPFYALLAGKEPAVQISALWHARRQGRDPLPDDLIALIRNKEAAMIIADDSDYFETDPAWLQLLTTYYRPAGHLSPTEAPPTLSGMIVRPRTVYVPQ